MSQARCGVAAEGLYVRVVCAVITAVPGAVALVVPRQRPEPVGVPAVREPALASA